MPLASCFCFDLKIGATIIGLLDAVWSANFMLSILHGYMNMDALFSPFGPLQPYIEAAECDSQCIEYVRHIVVIITAVALVLNALNLIAGSLLVHGILKERPALMNFYLVKQAFTLGLLTMCLLLTFAAMFYDPMVALKSLLPLLTIFMFFTYFFMVVRDYKIQLMQKKGEIPARLVEEQCIYPVKG